jgi:hypothetical protein
MKNLFILLSLILLSTQTAKADPATGITLFESDGCSKWPEGTAENPHLWRDCCFTHDLHYWMGGTSQERLDADVELKQCVESRGQDFQAIVIYMGVRVGGTPNTQASFRWGFGWPEGREYAELTEEEKQEAASQLRKSNFTERDLGLVDLFISEKGLAAY